MKRYDHLIGEMFIVPIEGPLEFIDGVAVAGKVILINTITEYGDYIILNKQYKVSKEHFDSL